MSSFMSNGRGLVVAVAAVAVLATSGCGWMRGKTGYELSPESRPLEIPPDLDAPARSGALSIPNVSAAQQRAQVASAAFTIEDTPSGAYERAGLALSRIEGVTINERSQLLTMYTVTYEGETFLIRIGPEGGNARISAVTREGRELTGAAAGKLLGLLRQRLG